MDTKKRQSNFFVVGVIAVALAFVAGLYIGQHTSTQVVGGLNPTDTGVVSADQFAPFWKAWGILDSTYITAASTTDQDKVWGAIKGLAASYGDPYTVFFPPSDNAMFQSDIAGNFEGVGMEIGIKADQLTVVAPLKGSPAEAAGVKTGDAILTINGTSTSDMSTDEAVDLIRGPAGTSVKISFLPVGASQPVTRTLTRAVINIPTLDTDTKPGGIFVIHLYSFTADSADLFRNALRTYALSGDHKLIIDLRGNPGGYLDAAWDMASYFVPLGKVVVTEDFGGNTPSNVFRSKGYSGLSVPDVVVLVDGGSASAAEILAGALEENGVAKLVGTKTFGKGSVQELIPVTSDTSLKVTVARWLTPNGHNLSHDGLDPDYVVPVTDAQVTAGKDPQMDKAVQLLTAMP